VLTFELLPNSALTIQFSLAVLQYSILHHNLYRLLLLLLLLGSFTVLDKPKLVIETVRLSDDTAAPYDPFVPMPQVTVPLLSWVVTPSLWIDRQVPDISPLALSDSSVHSLSSCHAFRKQESSCPFRPKFSWGLQFDTKAIPWNLVDCENLLKFNASDYFQLRIVILDDCSILM